ncbi:hypothetical protein E2C01_077955 [Portunus trituberculatus]|uniref:Uncharacterized protein n=1 Tax=Portunus trituberculatus TaxID=210409 RepID=A0A5B7IFR6_PORTR|nr:hypothetical protein [Portunus trituberculatus]
MHHYVTTTTTTTATTATTTTTKVTQVASLALESGRPPALPLGEGALDTAIHASGNAQMSR